MKNRNIPFGFQYTNGIITENPDESKVVLKIFTAYLDGLSLLEIANMLNHEKIEYMPGITGWNKARLKRIIEDERYIGKEPFPCIIDPSMHKKAQHIKWHKNTQKSLDRTAGAYQVTTPVLCESCQKSMGRVHDNRSAFSEKWVCSCGFVIKIDDNSLLAAITQSMNQVIDQPDIIRFSESDETEMPIEILRLENTISRMLVDSSYNKEDVKKKIFECASLKFRELKSDYIIQRLKADFEKSGPLSFFDRTLFDRTVSAVILHSDGTVSLILKNGQQTGKECKYADTNSHTAKNGTNHPTYPKYGESSQ